jgi:hypothetical protein
MSENETPERSTQRDRYERVWRANRAFGPVVAGIIIDGVDFVTFGPIGLICGLPIGGLAGYWLGRCLGFDRELSIYCGLAAGIYCTIPGTEFLPLGTMIGAYARYEELKSPPNP